MVLYILYYFISHYILNGLCVFIISVDAHTHPAFSINDTTSAVMMENKSILMTKRSPVLPNVLSNGRGGVNYHHLASIVSKLQSILFPHTLCWMKQVLDGATLMKLFHYEPREEALPCFVLVFSPSSITSLMTVHMETLG